MICRLMAAALSILLSIDVAPAQDLGGYPSRPIRLIVPFAAGGGTDSLSRIFGQVVSEQLGGSVIVENIGGAGGTLGIVQAAKAAADGYTLLSATPSIAINPHIQKNVPYNTLRDFVPVVQITTSPFVLIATKGFPIASVRDLLDLARARPGTISYGSAGIGSASFLSAELFKAMAGVDITHIPYRGTGPALIDLIAGRIQVQFENAPAALPQIRSGELKAIAAGTARRSLILPDLPTIAETVPGYEASSWLGLLAPAGTPRPVIDKLNAAINKSLGEAAMRRRLADLGVEAVGGTPEEFGAYLKAKVDETDRIAKAAGLRTE
jgi:tripartite-type tricarboxylate transporter receptor subunit TctC